MNHLFSHNHVASFINAHCLTLSESINSSGERKRGFPAGGRG